MRVCEGVLSSSCEAASRLQGPPLPASLAEVAGAKTAPAMLLVSSGRGDLRLVSGAAPDSGAKYGPVRNGVVQGSLTAWQGSTTASDCVRHWRSQAYCTT